MKKIASFLMLLICSKTVADQASAQQNLNEVNALHIQVASNHFWLQNHWNAWVDVADALKAATVNNPDDESIVDAAIIYQDEIEATVWNTAANFLVGAGDQINQATIHFNNGQWDDCEVQCNLARDNLQAVQSAHQAIYIALVNIQVQLSPLADKYGVPLPAFP